MSGSKKHVGKRHGRERYVVDQGVSRITWRHI